MTVEGSLENTDARARLRDLGVPERDAAEHLAHELGHAVERGDLSAEAAEQAAGRFLIACSRQGIEPMAADELAARFLLATVNGP